MRNLKEFLDEGKYLKYSDLLKAYSVSLAKDGGQGPESKKIKAAMDAEKKKLGIKEGKYSAYSDLLVMKARIIDKEGPKSDKLPAVDDGIRIAMKKLGIKEEDESAINDAILLALSEDDILEADIKKDGPKMAKAIEALAKKAGKSSMDYKDYIEMAKLLKTNWTKARKLYQPLDTVPREELAMALKDAGFKTAAEDIFQIRFN